MSETQASLSNGGESKPKSDPYKGRDVPLEVYKQLLNDFVPAVKSVANHGAEVLKCHQSLQRANEHYAHSLGQLAKTSEKAFPKAKKNGRKLNQMAKEFAKLLEQHKKCIKEMSLLVEKTSGYSNDEKETLKQIYNKHEKEERGLQKRAKKGENVKKEMEEFKSKQQSFFLRQQEMRYRFFVEKHQHWFDTYSELAAPYVKPPKEEVVPPAPETTPAPVPEVEKIEEPPIPTVPPELPLEEEEVKEFVPLDIDDALESAGEISDGRESALSSTSISDSVDITQETPILTQSPHLVDSATSARGSVISSVPSRPQTTDVNSHVVLISERRRESNYRPLQPQQADVNKYLGGRPESFYMSPAQPVAQPYIPPREIAPDPIVIENRNDLNFQKLVARNVPSPVESFHAGAPAPMPRSAAADYRYSQQDLQMNHRASFYGQDMQQYQKPITIEPYGDVVVQPRVQIISPRTEARRSQAVVPDYQMYDRPRYHVESNYNPKISPAHQPPQQRPPSPKPVSSPLFNNSDYGRTMTVNQDFNATSAEQITVNKGDKVVLIKSGNRGWIFIKDSTSQMTGWIPAPYVSLQHF